MLTRKPFFKTFKHNKLGDVVVICQRGEDGPELRMFFDLTDVGTLNAGVCQTALEFADDDKGWDSSEKFFNELTEEDISQWVKSSVGKLL